MANEYTQLFVRGSRTKAADEHLQAAACACFKAPDGVPVMEPDGTYEVRCYGDPGWARFLLEQHYGFTIDREVKHQQEE